MAFLFPTTALRCAVPGNDVSKNPFKKLLASKLARSLVLSFLLLAVVEGTFLVTLSALIVRADKKATHEFRELQAANYVGQNFQTITNLFFSVAFEKRMKDPTMPARVAQWIIQSNREIQQTHEAFVLANHDVKEIELVEKNLLAVQAVARRVFQDGLSLQQRLEISWSASPAMHLAADEVLESWRQVRKILEPPTEDSNETSTAVAVLNLAIAVNLLALVVLVYLVNRSLVSPLRRLALECDNLKHAKLMPRPQKITNEIGSLEESFFQLSQIIKQNEQRKLSSAEMLKTAQTVTLDKLSSCLDRARQLFSQNTKAQTKLLMSLASVDRLQDLLDSLGTALRSRRNQELNITPCNLNTLLETAIGSTESLCEQRNVSIRRSGEQGRELLADQQLVVRVLVNLLSNAIKFSPMGAVIDISVESSRTELLFRVTDRGPGLSQSDRLNLFQPFMQTQSAND